MPVHTTGQWGGRPSVRRPIRLVLSKIDRIIAIAEAQRDYLVAQEGIPEERITVIPNGIPLSSPDADRRRERRAAARARLGAADGTPVIGITAVLRPEKNHELLLRAFARVRAAVPGAELWIVGDGPRRPALEAEAARLGLACGAAPGSAVRLLGHVPDARAIIAGFDVAALSSHPLVETLPLTVVEAMDEAVPVVATRVGALAEMVEAGRSGILVEPGDEAALAEALTRLLRDPAERLAMGERGQATARERYSVERMCAATERLLLDLLGRRPRRGAGTRLS
jgi:glycosyltransferase involved in cell wall biosynthesis